MQNYRKKSLLFQSPFQNKVYKAHINRINCLYTIISPKRSPSSKTRFFCYICSMKNLVFAIPLLFLLIAACSRRGNEHFAALDRAIELQDVYDLKYDSIQDSLRLVFSNAQSDSTKWEALFGLESFYFYHDIDSCYSTVMSMLNLCGDDIRQKSISECCYANILYKMDSIGTALHCFRQIDTVAMPKEALDIYCFAGYHIFGRMAHEHPEFDTEKRAIIDKWWKSDSTRIDCAYYYCVVQKQKGNKEDAVARIRACNLRTPNDTAKANYFLAKEYLDMGETDNAIYHFTKSAECDMRLAAKAYNSLYELALLLFRNGDIERADRYMRITLKDAYSSHYESRYDDVITSELEIMNVLLEEQKEKRRAYISMIMAFALLLAVAIVSLIIVTRYSSRLDASRRKLAEVSKIKDNFLAMYMEKCVDYLNKVDEYRSSLRRTMKQDGPESVAAMLRRPSFADGEFDGLLSHFDSAFLGIFPDFVDKVNLHMQEEYRMGMPSPGELSTELRILALIRMGISKRMKIAKVLNMSVTTVYSYHTNLQKHSLHPHSGFDSIIANL